MLGCRVVVRVLDDPLAHFEGQIESAEFSIAKLEVLDDAQRLQVVIKELAVPVHRDIQRSLACVPKRGMANVMHQRESFYQVNIEIERGRNGAGDLCDLDAVRQAGAKVVGIA